MSFSNQNGNQNGTFEPAPVQVTELKTVIISQSAKTSFRAQISIINGAKCIGFVKFYFNERYSKWLPTKPAFYFPIAIWEQFKREFPDVLKAAEDAFPELKGMFRFTIKL